MRNSNQGVKHYLGVQIPAREGQTNFALFLFIFKFIIKTEYLCIEPRVSVQGVKSLGGHFACLSRGLEFYEVKKNIVIIFQKENANTFTLLIIFIVKSLQKEQNSTDLLL